VCVVSSVNFVSDVSKISLVKQNWHKKT